MKEAKIDTQVQDGIWLVKNKGKAVVNVNQAYVDEGPHSIQAPEHPTSRKGQVVTTHKKSLHYNKFSILEEVSKEGYSQATDEGLESSKAKEGALLQDPALHTGSLASLSAPQPYMSLPHLGLL